MKNYLSTKKGSYRRTFLPKNLKIIGLLLIGLLILFYLLPKFVFGVVSVVVYPFEAAKVWLMNSSGNLPAYWRDRTALLSEIDTLKQQLDTTSSNDDTLVRLQAENEKLRLLYAATTTERVTARLVGRPPQLPYDVVLLDRGSDQGVVESAPVFVGQDQVIGYVSRVYAKTSLVTLLSTANFKSMAYIIGPDIYTEAVGVGGGLLRVIVPQGIPLAVGDVVIMPAIDSGVYGSVSYIETSPTQPEQYGYVPMKQNLQSLQYVSIGKEPIATQSYEEAETLVRSIKTELFSVDLPPGVLVVPQLSSSTATTTATGTTATSVEATTASSSQN